METDDDEVVDEVDVYLNTSLSSSLHVFQYWSQESPIANHSHHNGVAVKARPNHRVFEIESKLDNKSGNFDEKKCEQFGRYLAAVEAKAEPKKSRDRERDLIPRRLDKQVLKSVEVRPTLSQYCVAVIRPDCPEVHLNPIQSVIQFKPKLNYLDEKYSTEVSSGVKPKTGASGGGDEESEAELSSQDEAEAQTPSNIQTITMRFAGPDEDKKRKARENSFAYLQQTLAKDPWIPIRCHPMNSQLSSDSRLSLVYNSLDDNSDGINSQSSVSSLQEFLTKLKCFDESSATSETITPPNSQTSTASDLSSLARINTLPVSDQVRQLLINAKLLSFDEIMSLLKGQTVDTSQVLINIQMYAILVRGHWVVKSEVLYDAKQCPRSASTGIPIALLCRTRDYIIWRFTQTPSVLKKDLFPSGWKRIPDEDVVDILKQMAVRDTQTKVWSFAFADDLNFVAKYPAVVQRQQLLWSTLCAKLERDYTSNTPVTVKTEAENAVTIKILQPRKRRNSRKGSTASIGSAEDKEVMEALESELNCSPTKMRKDRKSPVKTRKNSTTSAVNAMPALTKERRRSKSPKVAVFEINPTPNPCPSVDETRELVKAIHERLKITFCVPTEELRRSVTEATNNGMWFGVTEDVIERSVRESGGFRVQNKWPQNSPQQPLYAMTKFGDPLDAFREALIEMFADQTRIRVTTFVEEVRDRQLVCGDKNYETTCAKLLKDFCVYKASYYYLKGTVSPN